MHCNNFFNSIPKELTKIIIDLVEADEESPEHRNQAVLTCSFFYHNSQQQERLKQALAIHITDANPDKACVIVERYPELMLAKLTIVDNSGRIFEDITIWQYLLWAMDVRYTAPILLDRLPRNEIGEKIRLQLLELMIYHQTHGVTYILEERSYTEIYYNWSIIKTLGDSIHFLESSHYDSWYIDVANAQRLLPAHVAQHYCDPDMPFTFWARFTRKMINRCLVYWNESPSNSGYIYWYARPEHGEEYLSRIRGTNDIAIACVNVPDIGEIKNDQEALQVLYNTRKKDLDALKQLLEVPFCQTVNLLAI